MSPKRKKFIDEYLIDLNATAAAKRAGFSPRAASTEGFRLLKNAEIQAALRQRRDELAQGAQVTPERVIREYARLAFSDMRRFSAWGPGGVRLTASDTLTDDEAAAVVEVSQTTTKDGGSLRFRLHDKTRALDSLSKTLGLFITEKPEIPLLTIILERLYDLSGSAPTPPLQGAELPTADAGVLGVISGKFTVRKRATTSPSVAGHAYSPKKQDVVLYVTSYAERDVIVLGSKTCCVTPVYRPS